MTAMYAYDAVDRDIVAARVDEFRDQVRRRMAGELTEDEFKPLRLMNGLYLQLHGYMLRVAIPYGTLSSDQMRQLAHIARRYDRGYGHFTTRQNIQYNWVRLQDTPDILADLAAVDMHAIQTSGNCIRNVTSDPLAGVAADEIEDPRITCEVIRQWSTFHPEFAFLPRKFKIAVTGSPRDRAAIAVHDIGIQLARNEDGEIGYHVLVGGGQGRTPHLATKIRSHLPREWLLGYLEAVLRVYNRYGRRDNMFKARIKILVKTLGAERFREEVEAEWARSRSEAPDVDLPSEEWSRIASHFRNHLPPLEATHDPECGSGESDFARWVRFNVAPHKVLGYAAPTISLKPTAGIPGDASADQMDAIAELAARFSRSEIRVTHRQNLVLPHVPRLRLGELHRELELHGLATANHGLVTDIIACPGMDYCTLANTRSIPVARDLAGHFADTERQADLGALSINISGCINACGHHHVGNIGILGIDKRGREHFQIAVGGSADENASLGTIIGPAVPREEVPTVVERITNAYRVLRIEGESFIDTWRRLGAEVFEETVREDV